MIYRILVLFSFLPFITNAQFQDHHQNRVIGAREKQLLIDSLIHTLKEGYVYPEIAKQIETRLYQLVAKGSYKSIDSAQAFCDTLSNQLVQWSDDKHLRLAFSYDTIASPTSENPPLPDFIRDFAVKNNFGFNKVQILDGNIGYINILGFFPMEEATQKGIACMEYVADTRALIIDLRENSGGFGAFCNFMLSYFFSSNPVHMLDMNFRQEQKIEQSWSSFYVPGKRYLNKSVYVLTSASTFSAGEAFAYILQAQKRATVIGEATGGGANIGTLVKLSPHFVINLPTGTVVSPVTHKGWEKIGVQPDVKVSAVDALKAAQEKALNDLDYLRRK